MKIYHRVVLSLALVLALTVPMVGTASAQGSDCAIIDSKAPPLSITKGFDADWVLAFSYLPFINQNCSLDARITINPGFAEFGILQITKPYTCTLPSLTDARCSGTATTRADLSVRLHGRSVGQSGITLTINGKTFFYSVFVVSPSQIFLPLINVGRQAEAEAANVGTVAKTANCGSVTFRPSPNTINVGETKQWDEVFYFSPSDIRSNCELSATVTISPSIVGFKLFSIDRPYTCVRNGVGNLFCSGTAISMAALLTNIQGLEAGKADIRVKVNEVEADWKIEVNGQEPLPANKLFLPLAAS